MARAKQNSAYIKPNDGSKNNGRKKGDKYGPKKQLIKSSSQLTPAKKEVSIEIWKLFTKLYNRWHEQNKTQHT